MATQIETTKTARAPALELAGMPVLQRNVPAEETDERLFANGRRTNVMTEGRAAPVACEADRQCWRCRLWRSPDRDQRRYWEESRLAEGPAPVPGLEGLLT